MSQKYMYVIFQKKHPEVSIEKIAPSTKDQLQPTLFKFGESSGKLHKYGANDFTQKKATDALVLYIAEDLLPLSTVESSSFKRFVHTLDSKYQIPTRKTLKNSLIADKSKALKDKLRDEFLTAKHVSLTTDLWTNRSMKGFLGITGHYILDWCLKSVMVSCSRFQGRHSAENIRQEYEEVVSDLNVRNKISYVVSDNASNMVKAFKMSLPGFEKTCVTDNADDDLDENDDMDLDDDEPETGFKHMRCYAHTLQLVVRDGLRDCSLNIHKVVAKASKIAGHIRKSTAATEVLEAENRVQIANATRWNSQLVMIRSILNIPEEKLNLIDFSPRLTSYERKLLTEVCQILNPFEMATNLIQCDKTVSASMTIPVTIGLKRHLDRVKSDYNTSLVERLRKSTEQRLSVYEQDDTYITAAILDPRFKLTWCNEDQLQKFTSDLKRKVVKYSPDTKVFSLIIVLNSNNIFHYSEW